MVKVQRVKRMKTAISLNPEVSRGRLTRDKWMFTGNPPSWIETSGVAVVESQALTHDSMIVGL
jgi:hypothetical protein